MTVPTPALTRQGRTLRALTTAGLMAIGCGVAYALGEIVIPDLPVWVWVTALVVTVVVGRAVARRNAFHGLIPAGTEALGVAREEALRLGGGAFIGLDAERGGVLHAPAEAACLVLGPPRRGKTSSVIVPSVLCAPGAALVTSTKPDVLVTTAAAKSRFGTVYAFDPTGLATDLPAGVVRLRWSPLDAAGTWESARRLASAMVAASPAAKGTRHESHWTSRAAALLGPLLYAAALSGKDMVDVVSWVLSGEVDNPKKVLEGAAGRGLAEAVLAGKVLDGVDRAAAEERQSIWSATADVVDVYTTLEALEAASGSNFDPARFVRSRDTVYIASPAEHQNAAGPLVVALIEAVRDAQYRRHRFEVMSGRRHGAPVSLILDEVANVAPIASLPTLVSEAGGQGLHVLAAIQDLSQVRGRWGIEIADGFLSLFQHVLVLGGIRDTRTLEALSVICGEWDRPHTTTSRSKSSSRKAWYVLSREHTRSKSTSYSTVRQRRLTPGEIYELADGHALYLSGAGWGHVRLAPHYAHPRWQAVLASAPEQVRTWQDADELAEPAGSVLLDLSPVREEPDPPATAGTEAAQTRPLPVHPDRNGHHRNRGRGWGGGR